MRLVELPGCGIQPCLRFLRSGAQLPRDLITVLIWQANIEDDDVWLIRPGRRQCLRAIMGGGSVMANCFQEHRHGLGDVDIVVNHQDAALTA